MGENTGLKIALISIHGLIRGRELELGVDADTGGQILYVVELARALGAMPEVAQVDLLTRRIVDSEKDAGYGESIETLAEQVRIVRIDAGPAGYLPKEELWDHLDTFVDNTTQFYQSSGYLPELIHSHYADAGYVGCKLAHFWGLPLIHTGHSLGRVKRSRMIASGINSRDIEERYKMSRRVEAEENTLAVAERVITSTRQEIEQQYELYDYYQPEQMEVIPPGTDLARFHPPQASLGRSAISEEINRFLCEPDRPVILALSRPDPRKNIQALVTAYGEDAELQQVANLVIIAGNRDDIADLDSGSREVMSELLFLIDHYDLYGKVAYPKHHQSEDVPAIFRMAAEQRGVFVNPALTEPFGLTLIEAAASGLPIVATEDGGPQDILGNCENGVLVNPLDTEDIARGIKSVLLDWESWQKRAINGLVGVRRHYTWEAHAKRYLQLVQPIAERTSKPLLRKPTVRRPKLFTNRAIFSDLDQNLLSNPDALPELSRVIRANRKCASFGIATGRRLDSALAVIKKYRIPMPDVLITSGGSAIHYPPKITLDRAWARHIEAQWTPQVVHRVLDNLAGLKLQRKVDQSRFKISYYYDPAKAPSLDEINQLLHKEELAVNAIISFGQYLDLLPLRASKGLALRYVAANWGIPLENILVAGGSGTDEDMMRGNTLAVVVGNRHHEELSQLADGERIFLASAEGAAGILEAIEHYDFYGHCAVPTREPLSD